MRQLIYKKKQAPEAWGCARRQKRPEAQGSRGTQGRQESQGTQEGIQETQGAQGRQGWQGSFKTWCHRDQAKNRRSKHQCKLQIPDSVHHVHAHYAHNHHVHEWERLRGLDGGRKRTEEEEGMGEVALLREGKEFSLQTDGRTDRNERYSKT